MRKMKIIVFAAIIIIGVGLSFSCDRSGQGIRGKDKTETKITQGADGIISLNLEKATCYNDNIDPSSNTAEWNFIVVKPGRYDVWVSSLTKDTMDLQYTNSVKVNLSDERLEGKPIGNKIIVDAKDVQYPYYRADSHMGTFYFDEPGEYSIQLISEKVTPISKNTNSGYSSDHTKFRSLILTPLEN